MPELKAKKLKEMSEQELSETYKNLRESLMKERASVAMGGAPVSPGKMRSIRRQIARVKTVMNLEDHK